MTKQTEKHLSPQDFHRRVLIPEYTDATPEALQASLDEILGLEDPFVKTLAPEMYSVPIESALYLYRRTPESSRSLVIRALGWGMTARYYQALAAAAREAYQRSDYILLGAIAFHFERSHREEANVEGFEWSELFRETDHVEFAWQATAKMTLLQEDQPRNKDKIVKKLQTALRKTLNRNEGALRAKDCSRAAFGYFLQVPEHFVLPSLLALPDAAAEEPLSILKGFLDEPVEILRCDEKLNERWELIRQPVLREKLQQASEPIDLNMESIDQKVHKIRNPFKGISGKLGYDPVRPRPKRRPQPGTDEESDDATVVEIDENAVLVSLEEDDEESIPTRKQPAATAAKTERTTKQTEVPPRRTRGIGKLWRALGSRSASTEEQES